MSLLPERVLFWSALNRAHKMSQKNILWAYNNTPIREAIAKTFITDQEGFEYCHQGYDNSALNILLEKYHIIQLQFHQRAPYSTEF